MARYKDSKGNGIPSVTEITSYIGKSDGLMGWAYNLGVIGKNVFRESSKNMKTGTDAHSLIEQFLNSQTPNLYGASDEVISAYNSFIEWHDQNNLDPVATELSMVCECPFHTPYGGTIDFIGKNLKKNYLKIVDWKTASKLQEGYLLQLIAYAHLWENGYVYGDKATPRNLGESIHGLEIVFISKERVSYKTYSFLHVEEMQEHFINCLKAYSSFKEIGTIA